MHLSHSLEHLPACHSLHKISGSSELQCADVGIDKCGSLSLRTENVCLSMIYDASQRLL